MTKEEIDRKYLDQANALENEYFKIVNETRDDEVIGQHRELKKGKSIDEFNILHGEIWRNHEAELIAEGYLESRPELEPPRDLLAEIDKLQHRVEELEAKK